ncbi:MAG: hypothetical protein KF895_15715 [Parvibaculum sp.]|nr:hypothetical protein [Gemmatimonadaceae bacterium]MBX3506925.1 hypothetical protein [Parvibaculum sp.]
METDDPVGLAIEEMLQRDPYRNPESDLSRRIRTALTDLKASRKRLRTKLATRLAREDSSAAENQQRAVAEAQSSLLDSRNHLAEMESKGMTALLPGARALVEAAELHLASVQEGTLYRTVRSAATRGETILLEWHHGLAKAIVALLDDDKVEAQLVILISGGVTLAAVVIGPAAATAAAVASAALLARELRQSGTQRSSRDSDEARRERAAAYLTFATGISDSWERAL